MTCFLLNSAKSAQLEPLPSGDLDVPTKVGQEGLVHSETPQDLVHSETQGLVDLGASQDLVHSETSQGLVHSESSQGLIHSKTSEHEDNHEISLVSSGAPGRVVQAFTMLQDSPEAQVLTTNFANVNRVNY